MAKKASKSHQAANISKSAQIINQLKRPNGASIPELMKVTTWQAHSMRGFPVQNSIINIAMIVPDHCIRT